MTHNADLAWPAGAWTWHEGPSIEDGNGVWWDVSFEDFGTFMINRETGERTMFATEPSILVDHRLQAIEARLTAIEALLNDGSKEAT